MMSTSEIGDPAYCAKMSPLVSCIMRVSNPSTGFHCLIIASLLAEQLTSLMLAYLVKNHKKTLEFLLTIPHSDQLVLFGESGLEGSGKLVNETAIHCDCVVVPLLLAAVLVP